MRFTCRTLAALELLKFHYGKASFLIQRDFQGGVAMRTGPTHRYPLTRSSPGGANTEEVLANARKNASLPRQAAVELAEARVKKAMAYQK